MSSPEATKKFRRILWEKQNYPDNFTPSSFPYCVVFNENARYRSFGYLLLNSLCILDHISLVILFFDIFLLCDNNSINCTILFIIDILLIIFGLLYNYSSDLLYIHRIYIIGIILIILCPFLRTLTESISTDTIWTMTIILSFIHLLTADYECNNNNNKLTATVSLNAGVFMSVLLGSRLKSNELSVSFLLFSFILFVGSHSIIRDIKLINKYFDAIISFLICILNFGLIYYQKYIIQNISQIFNNNNNNNINMKYDYTNDIRLKCLLYIYQFSIFIIVILGPIGFYRIQQYKVTIGGPWTYDTSGEASQYMVQSSNLRK